jgi:hypothetical protein
VQGPPVGPYSSLEAPASPALYLGTGRLGLDGLEQLLGSRGSVSANCLFGVAQTALLASWQAAPQLGEPDQQHC